MDNRKNAFYLVVLLASCSVFLSVLSAWSTNNTFHVASEQQQKPERTTATATSAWSVYEIKKLRSVDPKQLLFQNDERHRDVRGKLQWPKGTFWNRPGCTKWGVATTIFASTAAAVIENFVTLEGWCLVVVVADHKGGPESNSTLRAKRTVVVLSGERQKELAKHLDFVKLTPWNLIFGRKNIAYLFAIANGAQFIWDFDGDDNILFSNEILIQYTEMAMENSNVSNHHTTLIQSVHVQNTSECRVFNPYSFFRASEAGVWPRGFPLDKVNAAGCRLQNKYCLHEVPRGKIGVYQSVANNDPDVDAVYRVTRSLPVTFEGAIEDHPVVVPSSTMSPMNAQATLFSRVALWSLFLPTTVHERVSDIWRSFIMQTLSKQCDMFVVFVGRRVYHEGNTHDFLADLNAEKQLYERSGSLVTYLLNEWTCDAPNPTFEGAWEKLFVDLYERGILDWKDVRLAQLWISSLKGIGYEFPQLQGGVVSHDGGLSLSEGHRCKAWKTPTNDFKLSNSIPRFDDVVLVGQFNYDTEVSSVVHWVKRWRQVFTNVDVRGPFGNHTLASLHLAGIKAFVTTNDAGYFSPLTTLGDSLRLYSNDTSIRGVLMAHDDLLFNVSRLMELGFASDDRILYESSRETDNVVKPFFTIYRNSSVRFEDNATLLLPEESQSILSYWRHWRNICNKLVRYASPKTNPYLEADGGLKVYNEKQSDFLYVPTKLAFDFADHADWMAKNMVFLEAAMPTIMGGLNRKFNVSLVPVSLCTKWHSRFRGSDKMVEDCREEWPTKMYGIYHPIKMGRLGIEQWDQLFDLIVLGTNDGINNSTPV